MRSGAPGATFAGGYGNYDTAVMRYGTWMHFAINFVATHTDYVRRNNSASESVC